MSIVVLPGCRKSHLDQYSDNEIVNYSKYYLHLLPICLGQIFGNPKLLSGKKSEPL